MVLEGGGVGVVVVVVVVCKNDSRNKYETMKNEKNKTTWNLYCRFKNDKM
jgi:hypothetical protein